MDEAGESYVINCFACQAPFDALQASWCLCLVTERTLVCPGCQSCFCKAPAAYKQNFWSGAPRSLSARMLSEHHQELPPLPNPDPRNVKRPLVLLVDDEADIQRIAAEMIAGWGYGVVLARDGLEGLQLARTYKPDLILTDALMPKMDGREMCRQIKADPGMSNTKVAVMTGLYTSRKYETEAHKTFKVDDYLSKPLNPKELRALLQKHLG